MIEALANIQITIPFLKGIITVAEILFVGFALYWLWEMLLKLFASFGKGKGKSARAGQKTT